MDQSLVPAAVPAPPLAGLRSARSLARRTELLLAACLLVALLASWVAGDVVVGLAMAVAGESQSYDAFVVAIAGIVLMVVKVPLVLARMLPPAFERWQLRRMVQSNVEPPDVAGQGFASVSGYAVVVPPLLMIPLAVLLAASNGELAMLLFPLAAFLLLFAFVYHRLPNCRRTVKYAAFVTGSTLMSTCVVLGKRSPSDLGVVFWLFGLLSWCTVYVVVRRRLRPEQPVVPRDPSTIRAIKAQRMATGIGPGPGGATLIWMFLRLVPFIGDWFWSVRICSKERLARAPVLYLRAFGNAGTAAVLGKGVAPAIGRSCGLVSLVHPTQTSAALQQKTHPAWITSSFGVPDQRWQEWYLRQLSRALAVVVDAALITPSTRWGLETAFRALGRDRVAVLAPAGLGQHFADYLVFEYPPDRPAALEYPLRGWIDWVVGGLLGAPAA